MKIAQTLSLTLLFSILTLSPTLAGDKLLIGGSGWNKIAIIDKDTKKVEWEHSITGECNNVIQTKKGNILYGYSQGAAMINKQGEVIWDFKAKQNEELFTVVELKKGYLLAMCGNPARIIEVSETGDVIHELKYDTGIAEPHGQFRQVKATKRGTYIVPLFNGDVREIDKQGNLIRSVKVQGNAFSVIELPSGNWLIPCGDASSYVEVDPNTGGEIRSLKRNDIDGVKLGFVAELVRYKNGNTLIANWLGHIEDKTAPVIIEVDSHGKELWRLENGTNGTGAISAIYPLNGKYYR